MIDSQTECIAIIGNPVAHSLSPQMHNAAFRHLGLNLVYLAFEVENPQDAAGAMRALGIRGASITVPHKEAVVTHLDEVDETSRAIGAVNTVLNRSGRLLGYNTDWVGVVSALEQVAQPAGKRCLVLGAGGAARAAIYGLQSKSAKVFLMNRNETRGRRLAAEMKCSFANWQTWDQLDVDFVINATPVGMSPNREDTLIPSYWLQAGMVVLDMVYRPLKTRLLSDAEAADCFTISGLDMLLHQGAAQFEIWTGREPPVEVMRQALTEALRDEADHDH